MKPLFLSFTHAVALTAVNITPVAAKALQGRKSIEPTGSRSSATYSIDEARLEPSIQSRKHSGNIRESKGPRNHRNLIALAHKCLSEIFPANGKKRICDTMRCHEIICDTEVKNDWATAETGIEDLVHTDHEDKVQEWAFALVPLL
ncbi:hypothetical protein BKA70DRAFT_1435272 [Coprinopsis sp. MPI-PUGE-AT-0042]|nr:hypothetical protein BKA70DRAFT_1435272 [Coprinopsis sp. MPI-PUGE-AT-0042]